MVLAEEYLMKITKIENSSSPGMIVEFYCDLKACYHHLTWVSEPAKFKFLFIIFHQHY